MASAKQCTAGNRRSARHSPEAVVTIHRVFELLGMWAAVALGVCALWIVTLGVFKRGRGR